MKMKVKEILRKCKSLSNKLGRPSTYISNIGSKSERLQEDFYMTSVSAEEEEVVEKETIFVGSLRRRYVIKAKLLDHPLLSALIEKSKQGIQFGGNVVHSEGDDDDSSDICVKCEIVIFDHLLWLLENEELDVTPDSLEELADLYAF